MQPTILLGTALLIIRAGSDKEYIVSSTKCTKYIVLSYCAWKFGMELEELK